MATGAEKDGCSISVCEVGGFSLRFLLKNMAENTLVEWLRSSFSLFGKVVDAFIHQFGRKGQGRCFGFVRFRERRLP